MNEKINLTEKSNMMNRELGRKVLEEFDEMTKIPMEINEKLLFKILKDNANTEYGKKYGFKDIKSIEEYQQKVPVIEYSDIENYIERMKNGEKDILTAYSFDHMNETSGTTGKPKNIPLTVEQSQVFIKYNGQFPYGIIDKFIDSKWTKGKTFSPAEGKHITLDSGITVGCAVSKMADLIKGDYEPYSSQFKSTFTSPAEAMVPGPEIDTKYIHVRFAMMDESITGMVAPLLTNIAVLIKYLAINYETLINDIEKGTIDSSITLPEDIRESLLEKIEPMPERAAELREIFKNGSEIEFMTLIWPNLKYIFAIGGGDLKEYNRFLRKCHNKTVHNLFSGVIASEALISVPIYIDDLNSVLVPDSAFMEFLDVEYGDDFTKCVTMDKLEENKTYEIIVTTLNGLYRYRLSDAVKVTGFYNETRRIKFMYRVNKTINIAGEKTTEKMLRNVSRDALKEFKLSLVDYAVYVDLSDIPGKYVFLLETGRRENVDISREELSKVLLEKLCEINPQYKWRHEIDRLGMPEVHFIKAGSQLMFRDWMIKQERATSQFKPVRILTTDEQKEFFNNLREDN